MDNNVPPPKVVKVDSVPQLIVPQEPQLFRIVFLIAKYTFVTGNVAGAAASMYMLCSDGGIEWKGDNALIVLGLMFFIILAILALMGALKEECYVVLTYDIFILVIGVITVINLQDSPGTIWKETIIFVYVALCFFFAYMLYRRHPSPST